MNFGYVLTQTNLIQKFSFLFGNLRFRNLSGEKPQPEQKFPVTFFESRNKNNSSQSDLSIQISEKSANVCKGLQFLTELYLDLFNYRPPPEYLKTNYHQGRI